MRFIVCYSCIALRKLALYWGQGSVDPWNIIDARARARVLFWYRYVFRSPRSSLGDKTCAQNFHAMHVLGGLHRALEGSHVDGQVVRAFDWDQTACRVYALNNGKDIVQKVRPISANEVAHA